jgi:hypothetical protein
MRADWLTSGGTRTRLRADDRTVYRAAARSHARRSVPADEGATVASPTGIVPEYMMYPRYLGDVMKFLQQMPIPGDDKEKLFVGWARWVGVKINASQRAAVRNSGTDRR